MNAKTFQLFGCAFVTKVIKNVIGVGNVMKKVKKNIFYGNNILKNFANTELIYNFVT